MSSAPVVHKELAIDDRVGNRPCAPASQPEITVEMGRQRRREVVLVSAGRYDEMLERERLVEDLAWAAFAQERVDHPTSPPVSWDEAQRRRSRR